MRFLSLFAGIGGFDLGLERAGHECVGQVEIDPDCRRVLERWFPDARRWDDVRGLDGSWRTLLRDDERWECGGSVQNGDRQKPRFDGWLCDESGRDVDLLVGGFPCQDLSVAGKRAGLKGERSGLFWEIVRIAKEIHPAWGLFENVPGLLSSHHGRDFWAVLSGLRECWPAVGYRVLDSQHFGVAQRRRRVFFVCGPREASIASVLFEPEGGGGDSPAGEEAGTRVAGPVGGGAYGTGHATEDDPNLVVSVAQNQRGELRESDVAMQLTAGGGKSGEGYPAVRHGAMVRRLTPTECSRLQGFPDDWLEDMGLSDSTKYRQLGNAVTVPVSEWLGRRLAEAA